MRNQGSEPSRIAEIIRHRCWRHYRGPAAWPIKVQAQSKKVTPRKNVRNVIVIQNCGAMSPHETLDFKETKWTAKDLDIQKVNSDFFISKTLFPNYQKWAPRASLVRSMRENSLVHFPAQYHSQAGRAFNPAIVREIPALGSIIAMNWIRSVETSDTFPTFMSVDLWNAGVLKSDQECCIPGLPDSTSTPTVFQRSAVSPEAMRKRSGFGETLGSAQQIVGGFTGRLTHPIGGKADEYGAHYQYAFKILTDPRFKKVLRRT